MKTTQLDFKPSAQGSWHDQKAKIFCSLVRFLTIITQWSLSLAHNIGGVASLPVCLACHIIHFTHNSLQTRGKLYNYVVLDSSFIPVVILWLLTLDIWPLPPPLHVMGEALNTSLDGRMHEALFKLTSQFSRFLLSKLTKQALLHWFLFDLLSTAHAQSRQLRGCVDLLYGKDLLTAESWMAFLYAC